MDARDGAIVVAENAENAENTIELEWTIQFQPVDIFIDNQNDFVECKPYLPSDLEVRSEENGWRIVGYYGEDFATDHLFEILDMNKQLHSYTNYEAIPTNDLREIIKFQPEGIEYKYFYFYFSDGSVYQQYVNNDHSRWNDRLQYLMKKAQESRNQT